MADRSFQGSTGIILIAFILAISGCSGGSSPTDGGDGGSCEQPCNYYHECSAEDELDCIEGCCKRSRPCSNDSTCQPGGLCVDNRCVKVCVNDTDCPSEASCIFGFCEVYPQDIYDALTSAAVDEAWTEKKPLKVGIGDVALDFPIGVSMWGYGGRLGPRTPYRDTLGGSNSMFDRPRAKVFAFDNGLKRIILIKAPMGCTTDFMATLVAWRVYQATGENYLNRMVFSGPHSHSHPGRFWNIFPEGVSLGVLGTGDFSYEMFYHHSTVLTEAVLAALADLKPARFGYAIMDPMDTEGLVHHYRRSEYPDVEMDDTLVVMRIDDDQGNPRAVLVNMALHGTHFGGTTVSQDAPGGVELHTQQNLQAQTGLPVKAAFFSRCSGDVSPAGDGSGLDDWRKIQEVGVQAWPKIKQLFEQLEGNTSDAIDLDMASIRAPINREVLGYGPDEFYDIVGDTPCDDDKDCQVGYQCVKGMCGTLYYFGGFQCVLASDEDPATKAEDGHLGCIFSAETLAKGRPMPQMTKVRMSALYLGGLSIVTVPGEPLSQYGRDLTNELKTAGFTDATVFGYSQDHHLYIMHEDNWMQGGYEPSMGIWGWREGDYFYEKTAAMIEQFGSSGGFVDNADLKPTFFDFTCQSNSDCGLDPQDQPMICGPDDFCIVAPTATADPGTLISDVLPSIERFEAVQLVWSGGHPGVDLPHMTLERDDAGSWVKATNIAGEIVSDDGFSTLTLYHGDYESDHTWEITWEEAVAFPAGRYRIHIDGHYFDGSGTQSYQVNSQAIDFGPSTRLIVYGISLTNDKISGTVHYPAGPTNDDGESAFASLKATGYLLHSGLVPPEMPWPLPTDGSATVDIVIQPPTGDPVNLNDVAIDQSGQIDYVYVASRDNEGTQTTSSRNIPSSGFETNQAAYQGAGSYTVTVTATDANSNSGSTTVVIELQ
ncbi:MAG: hypothetical protein JRJ87_21155 [Deltaproteobacteria bacterium]|nr:hypothetical protein [Deltaproteobacteria bacterium]